MAARRIALAAALLLPLGLLHARAGAEIAIGLIAALFLLRSAITAEWGWLRSPFALSALAWWLWLVLCSALGTGELGLALAACRLPLLALALSAWVAKDAPARRAISAVVALAAFWIVLECAQQLLFGSNLFGEQRWADGALTGPFYKPRAGPALILLLFPVLVPRLQSRLAQGGVWPRAAALCLTLGGAASVLLIGQRMPSLLLWLGLALTGFLVPRLRLIAGAAAALGVLIIAAMPAIEPAAYGKLITHTRDQLAHFPQSAYGQIYTRAAVIAQAHPWHGLGVNGFRRACDQPQYKHGIPALGITEAEGRDAPEACNIHPHNYYLEAADEAGLPGLVLFAGMAVAALAALWGGAPGYWVGAAVAFFPVASTSAFQAMPNAGWIFLLIGLGLAEKGRLSFSEEKETKRLLSLQARGAVPRA